MIIEKVEVTNFRNHRDSVLELSPGVNILVGKNAQGKTNLLEAVFLTCAGRGWRTNKDKEMIRFGADTAHVKTVVKRKFGHIIIDIGLSRSVKKTIKINNIPVQRMGELMGQVNCVFFSPDELRLVKDAPADRRRFLDIDISQIDKAYFYALLKYNKTLVQRNALLKAKTEDIESGLNIWDVQLAKVGALIISKRIGFIQKLREGVMKVHSYLTNGRESVEVEYEGIVSPDSSSGACSESTNQAFKEGNAGGSVTRVTTGCLFNIPQDEIESLLLEQLRMTREKDLRLRTTTVGPHRDDLRISIDGKDVRYFASQGQQRTVALSLKLAELEIFKAATGEMPVLLLDDVFSELDSERQARLVKALSKCQSIITSVEFGGIPDSARVLKIEGGKVAL